MNTKIETFLDIAHILNVELDITPLSYGSLGLEYISAYDFASDDIDILVPMCHIRKGWNELKCTIEKLGYELYDLYEHEFHKDGAKIAFTDIESLEEYANVKVNDLKVVDNKKCQFRVLSLRDYKRVYEKSLKDGYRRNKGKKDVEKIRVIEKMIRDEKRNREV